MQIKNKRKSKESCNYTSFFLKVYRHYIPVIFIIVIVPLITYGKIIELNTEESNFWGGVTKHVDFFNYYKSIFFVLGTFVSIFMYASLVLSNKLSLKKEKRYYIPMSIYVILTIISTIMAHNKYIALNGFIGMNQGIFVLLSYMIITYILINYTRDEKDVRVIVYSYAVIIIVEGLLGLSQYFGCDFLQSTIGKYLIMPKILRDADVSVQFGKYTIYGTLNNTNFVGSFGALVVPLSSVLYLSEDSKKKSIIYLLLTILAFSTWLGCNSRAGYLGIITASIIGLVILRKVLKEKYKKILVLFSSFLIITLILNTVSEGKAFNQFIRLNPLIEATNTKAIFEQQDVRFDEISIKDNTFIVRTNKETLITYIEDFQLNFKDNYSNNLASQVDSKGNITFTDKRYKNYSFIKSEKNPNQIKVNIYGRKLNLYITDEQNIKVISINKKLTEPVKAPRIKFFEGRETFASNRGYIWSRTIPMLSNTIFIGDGPDNYAMVFPQEDYVGRFNVGPNGMLGIVVDKPHNMYLQAAINTGVISMLALITIWLIYLYDSFKIYYDGNINSFIEYMGVASFLSIIAYLVAGMFNDSVISVAPLFWILLGMGIGINGIVKKRKL